MSFNGQTAVVVGASAGIGEATARAFASAGAEVVIMGRSADRLDSAAERIGLTVRTAQVDATDAAAVTEFFGAFGPADHLVLAASPDAVGAGRCRRWRWRRCGRRSTGSSSRTSTC